MQKKIKPKYRKVVGKFYLTDKQRKETQKLLDEVEELLNQLEEINPIPLINLDSDNNK